MDLKLHRPQPVCSRTGRGFLPGDVFYSTLVRGPGGLERVDVAAEAWEGPSPGAIAWWRAVQPAASDPGPSLAPVDVLLDALEALDDSDGDAAVRYLLALQLVRRRILKLEGGDAVEDGVLILSCRRRDREYRVPAADPAMLSDPSTAAKLTALLWSGDAA